MKLDREAFIAGFNSVEKQAAAGGPQVPLYQRVAQFAASPFTQGAAKIQQYATPVKNWVNDNYVTPVKNWAGSQLRQGGKDAVNEKIDQYAGSVGKFFKNPLTIGAMGIGGGLLLAKLLSGNNNQQAAAQTPQQIEQQQAGRRFAFNKPPITG